MHPSVSPMVDPVGVRLADGGTSSMAMRTCFARDVSFASEVEGRPVVQESVDCEESRAVEVAVGCQLLPSGGVKSMEGVAFTGVPSQPRV